MAGLDAKHTHTEVQQARVVEARHGKCKCLHSGGKSVKARADSPAIADSPSIASLTVPLLLTVQLLLR